MGRPRGCRPTASASRRPGSRYHGDTIGARAAFHLRDIPDETYARLRARAEANGRSINAELLRLLEAELGAPPSESFNDRLNRLLAEWTAGPDAPDAVELIREDRDSR